MKHFKKMLFPVLLTVAVVTVTAQTSHTRLDTNVKFLVKIDPALQETKSSLGEVYGTRQCDGVGHLVQWRIEGCDETTFSPCKYPANETLRRSEVDFIPSADIEQLGFRLILTVEGKKPKILYDNPVVNSTVKAGQQYTSRSAGGVSKELQGKMVTTQYILYRYDAEKTVEICAEADFELV